MIDPEIIDYIQKATAQSHNGIDGPFIDKKANGITTPTLLWTYYGKLTYASTLASQTFSSLPTHDEWRLVFNLHNNSNIQAVVPLVQLNGDATVGHYATSNYKMGSAPVLLDYGTHPDGGANGAGWLTVNGIGSLYAKILGEMTITGKHFQGIKGMYANFNMSTNSGGIGFGISGIMKLDSNDVSSITIYNDTATFFDTLTGTVELWYKDNQ